jgi:GDPmannose 4,6-dehydratase
MPSALITGITGQDGSYLADLLLDKGYDVHGLSRGCCEGIPARLAHLESGPGIWGKRLCLHYAELHDTTSLRRLLNELQPAEIYHLAGQTNVGMSFERPESTCEITAMSTLRLLELVRDLKPPPRFFHASSSEVFGQPAQVPQDEGTPFAPVSPYGCAKAFATQMVALYRRSFGLFALSGILYNHESPRRGETFVTRKICQAAAAIARGQQKELLLGDLAARRDWGHARDYVAGMWQAMHYEKPEDFVFATGQLHSVREVVEHAFAAVGLDWTKHVRQDPRLYRPSEARQLVGNPAKAKQLLNWEPRVSFSGLITEMMQAEMVARARR